MGSPSGGWFEGTPKETIKRHIQAARPDDFPLGLITPIHE